MSEPPETFTEPTADRAPTDAEEAAAARAVDELDVDDVAQHDEVAMETGAQVEGEGEIEPS